MTKVLVLGSGAALPAKGRFNTTLAFLKGARTLLLDCAQPASELLFHHGVDTASVDTVVLTHLHADHVTSIGQLAHIKHHYIDPIYARALLTRTDPTYRSQIRHPAAEDYDNIQNVLRIYVPAGVEKVIRDYLAVLYLRPEVFVNFSIEVLPFGEGVFHDDPDFTLTAIPNNHIREYYPELEGTDAVRDSYSILVESDGRKTLYSSDLAAIEEIEPHAGAADLVFIEGAHFPAEQLLAFVKRAGLKRVAVHHILSLREQGFAEHADALAAANVVATHDGLEIEI
ncbi:MBL fold metallo-hydrolase [Methylopila musalis]|uniref:MBL fold metallo-hydrolase n=1 Tax=Methylopila musalis TaxID=1134781 RepID=A0ABW3Z3D9_9HYPH